jgi:hypothetical protein
VTADALGLLRAALAGGSVWGEQVQASPSPVQPYTRLWNWWAFTGTVCSSAPRGTTTTGQ